MDRGLTVGNEGVGLVGHGEKSSESKVKTLDIHLSVYGPTFTCGLEAWIMMRIRSWIQAAQKGFSHKEAGLRDRVRSSVKSCCSSTSKTVS